MSNLQNRNPNNREVHSENNGIDPGRNVAYRDGYLHGRASERRVQGESQEVRDNNNAARGLLVGIALTSLVGLTLATLFLLNRKQEEPVIAPVISPVPQATQSSDNTQTPQPQTTVIQRERTIERVPQVIATPTSPAATTQTTPRINVTVPAQPAPRVTVTVPPQPTPQVSVNVPQQPTGASSPNTTINVVPSQPQSSDRTNNSSAGGTNTDTTGTTQRSTTSGSGTISLPNTTGNTTNTNPNVTTGTSSRTSTQ